MKVYEVDFDNCAEGCDGWEAEDGLGGCPLLPCKEIAKEGAVIIKGRGVTLPPGVTREDHKVARGKVVSERVFRAGYILRDEYWCHNGDKQLMRKQAYTFAGDWIGDSRRAHRLLTKRGIWPMKSSPEHCVCSIGFCPEERKWYGWSHRAICGFGIGDRIFEEKYGNDQTPFVRHGRKAIRSLGDAKLAATRFAASVS